MRVFSWNDWNVAHIARHGVNPEEAEYVVKHARSPFPESIGDGKWLVRGRSRHGRWLQVIYVYPEDTDVDPDSLSLADLLSYSDGRATVLYVIHAMELSEPEKRRTRKRG